jgi:hypothetical protein
MIRPGIIGQFLLKPSVNRKGRLQTVMGYHNRNKEKGTWGQLCVPFFHHNPWYVQDAVSANNSYFVLLQVLTTF